MKFYSLTCKHITFVHKTVYQSIGIETLAGCKYLKILKAKGISSLNNLNGEEKLC